MEQPLPARSAITVRSSQPANSVEQPSSARSTSAARPHLGVKIVPMVPASVPISLRPTFSVIPSEVPIDSRRDKRYLEAVNLYSLLMNIHILIISTFSSWG
jgi:hypothetical protein